MPASLPSVFFLSDYGTEDEFVGVVHAVVQAAAPDVTVIDLTHQVPAFDVRAGAAALARSAPHLGPGVVLAVVDPGVGTGRRGLCLEVDTFSGPQYFVGPDNGLLVAAAEVVGQDVLKLAYELEPVLHHAGPPSTFDGRDLFGPVAAALCRGALPTDLGHPVEPDSVVRLLPGVVEQGQRPDGRACLRVEITWVDHFGNLQLAATAADGRAHGLPESGTLELSTDVGSGVDDLSRPTVLRRVEAFGDLAPSELGLLVDANGYLALVAGQASAAHWLTVQAGDLVMLSW
jgi:S-adenosyl-L-methionine hydrolase (adenosine-forming)